MQKKNKITAKGSAGLVKTVKQLRDEGYVMLEPQTLTGGGGRPSLDGWEKTISAQTYDYGNGGDCNMAVPMLHATSGVRQMEESCGTPGLGWMEWGKGNRLPNAISMLTQLLPYTSAGHKFNTDLCSGMGPQPMYRYSQFLGGSLVTKKIPYRDAGMLIQGMIIDLQKQIDALETESGKQYELLQQQMKEYEDALSKWEQTQQELTDFLDRNNLLLTYMSLCSDEQLLGICFPEIELQQNYIDVESEKPVKSSMWKPKAIGLRYRPAHICRLEEMDSENRINYIYMANRWYDTNLVRQEKAMTEICAIPALSSQSPLQDLRNAVADARAKGLSVSKRPTRFILPSYYPTSGRPYYPVMAWHAIFSGYIYDYAATIISDRFIRRKNSNIIGRIIYINNDYLQQIWTQSGCSTPEQKDEKRSELFHQINSWLENRDNSGQSLVAFTFTGPDGKEHESYKIVEVESASKNAADANQKELAEISSIIFFTQGLDSRLIGNTPGTESKGGGTDLRERYLLKQIQMSPTQQVLLKPLEVISRFNEWDSHLVWEIKREVLTTLDNSKTGITESEEN